MRSLRGILFGILVEVVAAAFFLLLIGIIIPETHFYEGRPVDAIIYFQWLLFSSPNPEIQISPFNMAFVQVLVAWLMAGFIAGAIIKKLSTISGLLSGFTVWLLFLILSFPRTYPWEVGSGSFLALILSTLTPIIGFSATKLRKKRGFFERLEEGGIHVPEHLKGKVELPSTCPSCNEKIFSDAEYCWNCKTKLQKGSADA